MKNFSRKILAWLIVLNVTATNFAFAPSRAEAFSLGEWLDIFGVGNRSFEDSKQRMIKNFQYSTALLSAAYENVRIATDDSIANKSIITQEQATRAALRSSDGGFQMRNGAAQNRRDAEHVKKYLSAALADGDEAKLKRIDSFIETANNQRNLSDFMAGIAYTQIGLIAASKVSGAFSGNYREFGEIIALVEETQELLRVRGELSNLLKTATAEYRLNRGIKDPSKEEQKRTADKIEKG